MITYFNQDFTILCKSVICFPVEITYVLVFYITFI